MNSLLTIEEIAEAWKVSVWTIYRLARRKTNPLPGRRVGGLLRFRPEDVAAWWETQPQPGSSRRKATTV